MPIEADVISPHKIAIVTGGSRGISRNTAVSLAKHGVNSIFTYNSNQAEAERVIGLVAEAGLKAIAGNNHHNMAFEKATQEELDSLYRVHFKGVRFLTQKLLPLIKDEPKGLRDAKQ
jgi:NAD(P)-dependent dehydrogenase (short-subunit alcohol dehydrogenase family)